MFSADLFSGSGSLLDLGFFEFDYLRAEILLGLGLGIKLEVQGSSLCPCFLSAFKVSGCSGFQCKWFMFW